MHQESRNFLQSEAWGEVNQSIGHKVLQENVEGNEILMIIKNAKRGRYLEVPGGPAIDWSDAALVKKVIQRIKEIATENQCVFARVRPQLPNSPELRQAFKKAGLKLAPMQISADNTIYVDLTKSEDELLADMRRQTRYEVRRADKIGIIVKQENTENDYKKFFKAQSETAKRQNFIPPSLEMLLAEKKAFNKNISLYVAYYEDKPVAYALVLWHGTEGDYFEAASTDLNRKYPGAYAIIWQAMRDLKKKGLKILNLCGIAPKDQPNHRYASITTFKTGFGGKAIEYVPAHDLIINKIKYLPDYVIEAARRKKRHL